MDMTLYVGVGGVRWPGLSFPLEKTRFGLEWLQGRKLDIEKVSIRDSRVHVCLYVGLLLSDIFSVTFIGENNFCPFIFHNCLHHAPILTL